MSGESTPNSGLSTGQVTPNGFGERENFHFVPKRAMVSFVPERAIASFENLVALANHQERLREARKMVWRDKGQPVVEMQTLQKCFEHAMSGGFRSATLAFNIRASVNVMLALIRIHRVPRDHRLAMIRHAIFGWDTWRFAAMLGSFTSLYKFFLNSLPILVSSIHPLRSTGSTLDDEELDLEAATFIEVPLEKRKRRLSLSRQAQKLLIRKKIRRWHAALAGAIAGGLAILWEKKGRKDIISQQMFVRGLQGSYNAFTTKRGLHVPHGDVLVFSLACGQIVYAFLLRPDTLPRSYTTWIGQAAKVPEECIRINRDLVRNGVFNIKDLDEIVLRSDITAFNKSDLLSFRSQVVDPPSTLVGQVAPYLYRYGPCSATHPALSSCLSVPLDRFFTVFKWMLPIYGTLHFVPAVLFKWKAFMQDPSKMLVKAGMGSIRSSAFLGIFVVIYQAIFCYKHNLHKFLTLLRSGTLQTNILTSPFKQLPQWVIDLLISKMSFWIPGLASGLALFVEEKRRRGELAMYVLPKGLESIWVTARGKGWVFRTGKWGDVILAALGMAMVMSTYQNDPQHLSGLVRRILYQFVGPN